MKSNQKAGLVLLATYLIWSAWWMFASEYNIRSPVAATVIGKMQEERSRGPSSPKVAFKLDNGHYYSVNYGLAYYSSVNIGDRVTLNLRPFDYNQTPLNNLIFFIALIGVAMAASLSIFGLGWLIFVVFIS